MSASVPVGVVSMTDAIGNEPIRLSMFDVREAHAAVSANGAYIALIGFHKHPYPNTRTIRVFTLPNMRAVYNATFTGEDGRSVKLDNAAVSSNGRFVALNLRQRLPTAAADGRAVWSEVVSIADVHAASYVHSSSARTSLTFAFSADGESFYNLILANGHHQFVHMSTHGLDAWTPHVVESFEEGTMTSASANLIAYDHRPGWHACAFTVCCWNERFCTKMVFVARDGRCKHVLIPTIHSELLERVTFVDSGRRVLVQLCRGGTRLFAVSSVDDPDAMSLTYIGGASNNFVPSIAGHVMYCPRGRLAAYAFDDDLFKIVGNDTGKQLLLATTGPGLTMDIVGVSVFGRVVLREETCSFLVVSRYAAVVRAVLATLGDARWSRFFVDKDGDHAIVSRMLSFC